MSADVLRAAVDRALDERRDPLDDEAVRAHLAEHPEDVGEVLVLVERLARVEEAEGASPRGRRREAGAPHGDRGGRGGQHGTPSRPLPLARGGRLAVAAAAALVAVLVWRPWSDATDAPAPGGSAPRVEPVARTAAPAVPPAPGVATAAHGRLLDWRMSFTRTGADGVHQVVTGPAGRSEVIQAAGPANVLTSRSETWRVR